MYIKSTMENPIQSLSRRILFFLLAVLGIVVLAGTAAWWTLKNGIEIDRLAVAGNEITRLYLRMDRGLIIEIDRLDINAGRAPAGGDGLEDTISLIKKWGHLIQGIDIKRLHYRDHTLAVAYRGGNFRILGDIFSLEAQPTYDDGTFLIDLKRLEIKPYRTVLTGTAAYSRLRNRFHFSGKFTTAWGKGEMVLEEIGDQVTAQINTDNFTDLTGFLQQFPLDEDVIDWVSGNISAESYRIDALRLQFSLRNPGLISPENIRGSAAAERAAVQFNPDLPPVQCDRVAITYRDDRLSFALEEPVYEGKNLAGSTVHIDRIIQPDSVLAIDIRTQSRLDGVILHLLEAYDIRLPLRQHTGSTRAEVNLLFDLPEFKLKTAGTFATQSGAWSWADIPFQAHAASVGLTDSKIEIREAEISYSDILRTRLSGRIDTSSRQAALVSEIEQLHLVSKETEMLQAGQMELPLAIDFSREPVRIDIDRIKTVITLNEGMTTVDIDSLTAIEPIVPILQPLPFSDGNIHFSFRDASFIEFTGNLTVPESILYRDDTPVTHFTFQGSRTPEKTTASVNGGKILINIADRAEVTLNDYLPTVAIKSMTDDSTIHSLPLPLVITGPQILLQVKDFQIPTRKFECRIEGTGILFSAVLEKGRLLFEASDGRIYFIGNSLDANLAEKFIRFTDLSEGQVNINFEGDADGYNGYLEFSNVVVREYLVMNNIIAFLNSVPALATFSEQGFDQEGYRVKDGIVLFDLQDKLLIIRQLRADGITVNCEARGWIDFDARTLKLDLELITLKDYSKIIDMLPWAGYAILGEDGSLSTSLKIDGSLDDPTITTYLAQDIIMTPVNIIWRTIEWPFKLFDNGKDEKPEPSEWLWPTPMAPE